MIELTFAKDLYDGFAIDSAARVFEAVASFEFEEDAARYRVLITPTGRHSEVQIANEFRNYALGATVERRRAEDAG